MPYLSKISPYYLLARNAKVISWKCAAEMLSPNNEIPIDLPFDNLKSPDMILS